MYTGKQPISCFKIYGCEILHSQSFLYKLYKSDTHPFNVFLKDSGDMTSIMAPALSNLIIKSNVGARNKQGITQSLHIHRYLPTASDYDAMGAISYMGYGHGRL